jgi:predicted transposase YdaD
LAVLAKSEQPEALLSQVGEKVSRIKEKRKQSNIAACVELLAGINYSEDLIAMYLQEDILQESVIYQKIINQGEKNEAIALVNRLIKKRFGEIDDRLQARIKSLSLEQLESLGESLFDFDSLDDVSVWLSQVHD